MSTGFAKVAEDLTKLGKVTSEEAKKILSEVQTYSQQRKAITDQYSEKRSSLYEQDGTTLKQGAEQGNVDELNTQEKNALTAIDEQFAQREATYKVWVESLTGLTLKQLKEALTVAQEELKKAEGSGADDKTLSIARAKVNKATSDVEKGQARIDAGPGKMTTEKWKKLSETLKTVPGDFDKIGTAIGGTTGEAVKTAGAIASSAITMITGIGQLATATTTGTEAAAKSTSASIKGVETASIILTVISAAIQMAMKIASLFNNDKEYQKQIESLQTRIDQLKWELDNAEIVRLKSNGIDILQNMRDTYAETTGEVLKLHAAEVSRIAEMTVFSESFAKSLVKTKYQNDILTESANKLAGFYANVGYAADKALGENKYKEAQNNLKNIATQQLLIQQQINSEDAKKKADKGKIAKWENEIQKLGKQAIELINGLVEDIMGGSSSEIAKQLGDAFINAFQEGENAAKAWGDKVNDIVADIMKRMLISKFLEEPLGEVFDTYKKKWFGEGEFSPDKVTDSMGELTADLMKKGDEFSAIWNELPDNIKAMLSPADPEREAVKRGIATASQESVNENNGLLTAIQGHTYFINENLTQIKWIMGEMVSNAARQLLLMEGIEVNTRSLVRLERIELDMGSVKLALDDINLKGIKLR